MLLERKRPLHGSESRPVYPRKRAAQACQTCRRRRTKCDNEQPACTSCTKIGVACIYREFDKASFDSASLAILSRLDDLEGLLRETNPNSTIRETNLSATSQTFSPVQGFDLDAPLETRFVNIEAVLSWPVLSTNNFETPEKLLNSLCSSDLSGSSRPLLAAELNVKDATHLLQLFLAHFHIYNPIIHVSKIEKHMRHTVLNGLEWDAQSCLLLLIYALGTIVSEDDDPHPETPSAFRASERFHRAESFFLAAQKRMGLLLFGRGVTEAQVFFLAGVYLMTTMRPVEAWKVFVQALVCCQAFQPPLGDTFSEESEMQYSIYWTCFKSEIEVRMELGIAETSICTFRYPPSFPRPPNFLPSEGEPAWYFYLAEIALRRLENRVLVSTCSVTPPGTSFREKVAATFEFERQANRWAESLPEALQIRNAQFDSDSYGDPNQHFRFILNGHFLDCLETVYWPYMEEAINGDLANDLKSNILADRGFEICVRRIKENEWGFHSRHHGTWLMLRSCTRSAFVLVAAARSGLGDRLPKEWQNSIDKVIELLECWKDEVKDAADRLEILKSIAPHS